MINGLLSINQACNKKDRIAMVRLKKPLTTGWFLFTVPRDYRGNGAVDIVADKDFNLAKYKDRGIILYGNKSMNAAWKQLLQDCPIQVERNKITAGSKVWTGDHFGAYFIWPIHNSNIASVAVISGSGVKGMQAANANQYFAGASGFPDFMIFDLEMLQTAAYGVKLAGFYDNNWKLDEANLVENK